MNIPNHLTGDLFCVVTGGDSGQPDGASKTEEQDAAGGEQTASAASGEFGTVDHHFCFSGLALMLGPFTLPILEQCGPPLTKLRQLCLPLCFGYHNALDLVTKTQIVDSGLVWGM